MAPGRRTPYKDFLQPSLQRRFSSTATILLGIAYVEAVVFAILRSPRQVATYSWWSLLFIFFPLGPTGVRAFFLFLCGLAVIVLRIAQYHVGIRTTNSGFQTALRHVASSQTLEAIVSYTLSSLLFSQVYLWSSTDESLEFILIQSGDRARLNEKPIFYTTHFLLFGVLQGMLHIFRDDDRVLLGSVKLSDEPAAQDEQTNWQTRLANEIPAIATLAAMQSTCALIVDVVLYHVPAPGPFAGLTIRGVAWRTALSFFRTLYTLPKTNMVPATHGAFSPWVWFTSVYTGAMLLFMWLAGNKLFSLLLVRAPLKLGQPLTSESADPNGSLLNGLKSKKPHIQCFALWELALIAKDFQPRRKAIYHDIDRKGGPMWSQVCKLCLGFVTDIDARIELSSKSPETPTKELVLPPTKEASQAGSAEAILLATPTKKKSAMETIAGMAAVRSPGQPSRLSPIVQKGYSQAKSVVDEVARQATSSEDLNSPFQKWTRRVLNTPIGAAFRQTYGRRITSVVLGTPYGEPSQFINAISALTRLALQSLAEDNYGNVQRDVASIIRTFTTVTVRLDKFKTDFPIHWTDLGGSKDCAEVDLVLATLKEALRQLIEGFGPYSRDIRLSFADMRLAREAAGMPHRTVGLPTGAQQQTEMLQVR